MEHAINPARFDLTTLRLFVAAVEAGSLTLGAEHMAISLPAASKRLAELESHVGSVLLVRNKKGVTPTAPGLTFLRYAISIVAGIEQLSVAMVDYHRGAGGHLRLWANTSAFTGFLPNLLALYSAAYPSVMLDLEDALSEEVVRAVARGNAELGIIGNNTPIGDLQALACDSDELMLVLPAAHPLASHDVVPIDEVLRHDIVGLNRATSLMRQIAAAADAKGLQLKIRVQVRGFDEVCRMIVAGLGIGILPMAGAVPHVKSMGLALKRLSGMPTRRQLLLVMRDEPSLSLPASALVRMVREREQKLSAGRAFAETAPTFTGPVIHPFL
ncbi:HTH-type transcriptional regulator CysL [mine drainage metagenome]|uniref:HTH-type transcriptional regulator CysL n=1 Tax=mine drainage metagenome TaxID=410659 RepID=A0A1J5QU37_9ZZZZ